MRTEVLTWQCTCDTGQLATYCLLTPNLPFSALVHDTGTGPGDIFPLPADTTLGFASKAHWRDKANRKGLLLVPAVFPFVPPVQHPTSAEFAGTSTKWFLLWPLSELRHLVGCSQSCIGNYLTNSKRTIALTCSVD